MGKIIVAGSINMDVVARAEHHPQPGETIFGSDLHYIPGGKGSNQAVAASRLREDVYLVGKLGTDAFGESLTKFLHTERLNLSYLSNSADQPTGVALIVVDDDSENTIVVISGSNYALTADDVAQIPLSSGDIVVSVFEIPQATILALFERARSAGATTILNPSPASPFIDGLQAQTDVLVMNETELAYFTRNESVSDDLDTLKEQAKSLRTHETQKIVLTLGGKGAVCLQGNDFIHVEGQKVKAVDTTGAGDCFTGALSVALSEGKAMRDALRFANTAASLSVQKLGASASMPTRDAVEEALH